MMEKSSIRCLLERVYKARRISLYRLRLQCILRFFYCCSIENKLSIEQLLLISFLFRKADVTYAFRSFLNRQQNFRGQG